MLIPSIFFRQSCLCSAIPCNVIIACFSGTVRLLTHWEQLDHGLQYTPTRKFLTIIPILLFFLASFYTHYQSTHFLLNSISLAFVLVRITFIISFFTKKSGDLSNKNTIFRYWSLLLRY